MMSKIKETYQSLGKGLYIGSVLRQHRKETDKMSDIFMSYIHGPAVIRLWSSFSKLDLMNTIELAIFCEFDLYYLWKIKASRRERQKNVSVSPSQLSGSTQTKSSTRCTSKTCHKCFDKTKEEVDDTTIWLICIWSKKNNFRKCSRDRKSQDRVHLPSRTKKANWRSNKMKTKSTPFGNKYSKKISSTRNKPWRTCWSSLPSSNSWVNTPKFVVSMKA